MQIAEALDISGLSISMLGAGWAWWINRSEGPGAGFYTDMTNFEDLKRHGEIRMKNMDRAMLILSFGFLLQLVAALAKISVSLRA